MLRLTVYNSKRCLQAQPADVEDVGHETKWKNSTEVICGAEQGVVQEGQAIIQSALKRLRIETWSPAHSRSPSLSLRHSRCETFWHMKRAFAVVSCSLTVVVALPITVLLFFFLLCEFLLCAHSDFCFFFLCLLLLLFIYM